MTESYRPPRSALGPLLRAGGSAASWFLLALAFGFLFEATRQVMAVGGSCASGGPYEIATSCPSGVDYIPLSLLCAAGAVVATLLLARGYGVSLLVFGWLALFGGLAAAFLLAFFATGDPIGLVIGALFVVMALAPLLFSLFTGPQQMFVGAVSVDGVRYAQSRRSKRSAFVPYRSAAGTRSSAGAGAWLLSLGIWIVSSAGGFWLAAAVLGW